PGADSQWHVWREKELRWSQRKESATVQRRVKTQMIKAVGVAGLERLELQRLRDRVGRLFAALQEATEADDPLAAGAWAPPVDLCETDDAINVRVELPGVAAEQVKIGLTNERLRICGEKKRRIPRNRIISYLCSERMYGRFSRVVPLRWS